MTIDCNCGALSGIQVLDLSHGIAGPFAARLLGDFGADVIKIEKPGVGDFARYLEPRKGQDDDPEQSLLFQYLNWNKRSVALDLRSPDVAPIMRRLVERSDVVIESFRPGKLQSWGLSVDTMLAWNPSVVVTSITNFGQTGPYCQYASSDLVFQAMSGIMQISGRADREPLKHGLNQSLYCAGLNAAYATLAALAAAQADGQGEHVDLSIHECLASELVFNQPFYTFLGAVQGRRAVVQDPFDGEPIPARDGYLAVQAGGGAPFEDFADLLQIPELLDPKYATPARRVAHAEELRTMLVECFKNKDPKELFIQGAERRLLLGVVQSAADLLDCEHLRARNFFQRVPHPATGTMEFPAEIAKLSGTPVAIRRRAPMLNEHQEEVLVSLLGLSQAELAAIA